MTLQIRALIQAAGGGGTPTSFPWGTSVTRAFLYPENGRLEKAYESLEPHAAFGPPRGDVEGCYARWAWSSF